MNRIRFPGNDFSIALQCKVPVASTDAEDFWMGFHGRITVHFIRCAFRVGGSNYETHVKSQLCLVR